MIPDTSTTRSKFGNRLIPSSKVSCRCQRRSEASSVGNGELFSRILWGVAALQYEQANYPVDILSEITILMSVLFLWGLYDYRRAPKKLTTEQRQKLKPIAKAWEVAPEELQNRVVPKAIMVISGGVGVLCVVLGELMK